MIEFYKNYLKEFRKNWLSYLSLFLAVYVSVLAVVIPIFNALAGQIMRWAGIPYISFNNLGNIISQHFLGALGLVILLLLLVFMVYVQFVFQILGVHLIQQGKGSFRNIWHETLVRLKLVGFRTLLFFLLYFILILPFGSYVFSSPLLAKVQIPAFTMEFFLAKWQNMALLAAFLIIVFVIGYRLILTLPLVVVEKQTAKAALSESWRRTKLFKTFWRYLLSIAAIALSMVVVSLVVNYGLWGLQLLIDKLPNGVALTSAVLFMTIIEFVAQLTKIFVSMMLFSFLLKELGHQPIPHEKEKGSLKIWGIILLALSLLILLGANTYYMVGGLSKSSIATISHRGVDEENGVQNTIPAMVLTHKHKPDFVEMDIQETKDKQFVVMHDANLKALTGVNKTPQELTLSELTKLTAHENGKSAPVASFKNYFETAQNLHQKLLIEIKTTPHDTPDLVKNFVNKYGDALIKNGDMVHSLDYNVVRQMKALKPDIPVSFILPFNLIFPQTSADAYTMEATTLNSGFVQSAHAQNKKVFAWTVNDPDVMQQMMYNQVDGIITDNLDQFKQQLNINENHPTYASRLKMLFSFNQAGVPSN